MTNIEEEYKERYEKVLVPLAQNLENHFKDIFSDVPRIDRISARPKSISRFLAKSLTKSEGMLKYDDPLEQIQDQIGVRIIVPYKQDVLFASKKSEEFFRYVESREVEPAAIYEFSYFGKHFVSLFPDDVIDEKWDKSLVPGFFELQIKTVFQHAWSEASHDIAYKPLLGDLPMKDKRALAFASAQAWGADNAFEEIFEHLCLAKSDAEVVH